MLGFPTSACCHLEGYPLVFSLIGATQACGTGACALVVAAVKEGRAERVCSKKNCGFLFGSCSPGQDVYFHLGLI